MAIARRDDYLTDAQGRALSGAAVYFCTQPATTTTIPPSPLATVYSDFSGNAGANPQYTDGFGHSVAYLDDTVLYTIVFVHPLFLNPLVLPDQWCGGGGGGGSSYTPIQASSVAGTITGAIPGSTFVLPSTPVANSLLLQVNGQVLTPNLGYTISGVTITVATALQSGDSINANYLTVA